MKRWPLSWSNFTVSSNQVRHVMYQMSSLDQRIFDSSHVRSSDVSLDHHLVLTCHWSHILQVFSFILVSRSILLRPPQTQAISPKICFFFCMVWLRPKSRKRRFPVPFPATVRIGLTPSFCGTCCFCNLLILREVRVLAKKSRSPSFWSFLQESSKKSSQNFRISSKV